MKLSDSRGACVLSAEERRLFVCVAVYRKKGRIDDVMKTPSRKDLSARNLCNPPALKLPSRAWPAIGIRSYLGFS